MNNVSFAGNVSTKMKKVLNKAVNNGQLDDRQVRKLCSHLLDESTDTLTYSIKKADCLPNHMVVDVFKKTANGKNKGGLCSGSVPLKAVPKTLINCISTYFDYI